MLERYSRISLSGNSKITPPPVPVNDTGDADACTFQDYGHPNIIHLFEENGPVFRSVLPKLQL
ncbi:hypothetical protein SFRURICE_015142 [Spodoptera frugiperda]|nr:hypothetical protein SFRURICE_015142 [Spodoptera frugiperda]